MNVNVTPDRQAIERFLRNAEKDLKDYRIELNRLKVDTLALEAKMAGLIQTMESSRGRLAPVHMLTQDNLMEVFRHVCEQKVNVLDDREGLPVASVLASICSRWRDVAKSMTVLWSSLRIDFGIWSEFGGSNGAQKLAKLTRLFLERSKSRPLNLDIRFPYDSEEEPNHFDWVTTMELLYANSHRWQRFEAAWSEGVAKTRAGAPLLSSLQHLTLHTSVPWDHEPSNNILDRFLHCPSLTSVSLDLQDGIQNRLLLPWTQLTAMTLESCEASSAFSVLSRCPHLKTLALVNIAEEFEEPFEDDGLVLPRVSSLSMGRTAAWGDADIKLLQHLTLPALSTLELVHTLEQMPSFLEGRPRTAVVLNDFITRSACSITMLRLVSVSLTDIEALCLLRLLPTLDHVEIGEFAGEPTNRIVTSKFIKHLFINSHPTNSNTPQTTFSPRLSVLKLSVHAGDLDEQALSGALASRFAASPRYLSSVEIVLIIKDEPSVNGPLSRLECFNDAELRLVISYLTTGED
ncbi:hypothetical protein V5O48_005736 [Marasmius crinis-equi]|uniref:F-box domain-containing protein n=1 Tax=Marasmius crinis-equi TaxID=585013 RepID=A0ABR3FLL5_9AGAR